jgi:peroxiredoxin
MTSPRPFPRQPVPPLKAPTLGGRTWRLADRRPQSFTLIVFYRGLHCPICRGYLADLERLLPEFERRGVEVIAISSDGEERARRSQADWHLSQLTIGYGLSLDDARDWGLYISSGIGKTSAGVDEPPLFPEPGLFLVRPDGTLYCASVQTMPFARPSFEDVIKAVDFVLAKDYPARGEVVDLAEAAE